MACSTSSTRRRGSNAGRTTTTAPGWCSSPAICRERTVRELFEAFIGNAAPDRPDRAALTDNPLIPFGGADR